MKKFFMIAVVAVAALTASAQTPEKGEVSLTPMVGMTYGCFTGYTYEGTSNTPDLDGQIGFKIGAELDYMASNKLKTTVGIHYINSSVKFGWDGNNKFKNNYLAIPILANFYVANGFAIKAGVQPAFLLSSKLGDVDGKDGVKSFDFTIPVGLSYEFSNVVIDARYNIGVQNMLKDDCYVGAVPGSGFTSLNNGYVTLTVGYKFKLK